MLQTENTWLVTSYTHLTNRYPVSAAAEAFCPNSLFLSFMKKHFFLNCSHFSWVMLSTAIVKVNVTANTFLRECQAGYLTVISITYCLTVKAHISVKMRHSSFIRALADLSQKREFGMKFDIHLNDKNWRTNS